VSTRKNDIINNRQRARAKGRRPAAIQHLAELDISTLAGEEVDHLLHNLNRHSSEEDGQNNELRDAQLALQESHNAYIEIYDYAPVGYLTLSPTGIMLTVNLTLADMLDVERDELYRQPFSAYIDSGDQDAYYQCLNRLRNMEFHSQELRLQTSRGKPLWVEVSCKPIIDENDELRHSHVVVSDITGRKQAELELKRYHDLLEDIIEERSAELARSEQELRDFVYIVSHDLRSPLVSIMGFTGELGFGLELLKEAIKAGLPTLDQKRQAALNQELDQNIPEALEFIKASTEKMDGLIKAILKLSRLGRRELVFEQVDIGQLVERELKSQAFNIENNDIRVKLGQLPVLYTDALAMEQIFGNLLSNAVKYLDPARRGVIEIDAEQNAEGTSFSVHDNGQGIATNDIPKAFEIFQRLGDRTQSGEGMGLAYVKALLRRLGGRIDCQSEPGHGTRFRFFLPHKDPEQITQENDNG